MEIVGFILALIGAAAWLPQLHQIWKERQKPKLEIFPDKDLQVGYNLLGPILNFGVSLISDDKRIVIKEINIELTHADKDVQNFTWSWTEEIVFETKYEEVISYTTKRLKAIALIVNGSQATELKIGFASDSYKSEKERLFDLIREEMVSLIDLEKPMEELKSSKVYNEMKNYYTNAFNWKTGNYVVKFKVSTSDNQTFEKSVTFYINSVHLRLLKTNIQYPEWIMENEFIITGNDEKHAINISWINTSIQRTEIKKA